MALTIGETVEQLQGALRDYIEATYHVSDPMLVAQRQPEHPSDTRRDFTSARTWKARRVISPAPLSRTWVSMLPL